jgi:hypothetical protein
MRQVVVKMLNAAGLDAVSVENPAYPGTPDINFCEGWIELKQLAAWPERIGSDVRIDCFTPQQRVWLLKRWRAGGNVWLLVQIGPQWLLFDGETAARCVGKPGVTQEKLAIAAAIKTYHKEDILPIITKGRKE